MESGTFDPSAKTRSHLEGRGVVDTTSGREVLVVWQNPTSRRRCLIGHLGHDGHEYWFRYERHTPNSLDHARQEGFRLFEEFPNTDGTWRRSVMFATFRRRLPPNWRRNEYLILEVVPGDGIEFLRVTGGRLPTDTLEFLEPIESPTETQYQLRVPVAGWRYYDGETVIDQLARGTPVRLELDQANQYDINAIRVLSQSRVMLGHVPAVYSWCLVDGVSRDNYEASVLSIGLKEDPAARLRIELRGNAHDLFGQQIVRVVPERLERYGEVVMA